MIHLFSVRQGMSYSPALPDGKRAKKRVSFGKRFLWLLQEATPNSRKSWDFEALGWWFCKG
jgi:hypothetical protein